MNTATNSAQTWYVLRGEMKYGPYEYKSLITMLQNGELYDYNFIWAPHLENWTLLGELPEFSKDRLCRLIETKDHLAGTFKDRKAERRDVVVPVFAHNQEHFFDGHTLSISANGALILMNDPLLLPNQKVLIHFRQSDLNPNSFNVEAEIIRKNFSKQRLNVKSGLHYAVRFLQVPEAGQSQIKNWTSSKEETNGILKVHE